MRHPLWRHSLRRVQQQVKGLANQLRTCITKDELRTRVDGENGERRLGKGDNRIARGAHDGLGAGHRFSQGSHDAVVSICDLPDFGEGFHRDLQV